MPNRTFIQIIWNVCYLERNGFSLAYTHTHIHFYIHIKKKREREKSYTLFFIMFFFFSCQMVMRRDKKKELFTEQKNSLVYYHVVSFYLVRNVLCLYIISCILLFIRRYTTESKCFNSWEMIIFLNLFVWIGKHIEWNFFNNGNISDGVQKWK